MIGRSFCLSLVAATSSIVFDVSQSRRERRALARVNHKAEQPVEEAASSNSSSGARSFRFAGTLLMGVIFGTGVGFWMSSNKKIEPVPVQTVSKEQDHAPLTLGSLTELSEEELSSIDVALMNLLCSEGLPGRGQEAISSYMLALDRMAKAVQAETARNFHRFVEKPAEYENSEEFYKVVLMNTVLGQDFGLRYNPDKIAAPTIENLRDKSFFERADDVFLSGLLSEYKMGTCSSMPVLLVAIGRRLGYPLKLVAAKGHLFCRWDDGKVRRNFECTNGISCFPDSHYQKWPFPVTDEEVKEGWYLRSLSPREELATFFALRGQVLSFHKRTMEALLAHTQANLLHPGHPDYKIGLAIASKRQSVELMGSDPVEAPMVYPQRNADPLAELRAINELNARNQRSWQPPPNYNRPSSSTSSFGKFPR